MNTSEISSKIQSTKFSREKEILENYLIVTTINKNYLKIFDLWYHYFKESNYSSILRVITIDKESDDYLTKKSIETIYIGKSTSNFNKIVALRFEIIFNLLKEGKNVIQTDADAIWLNPNLESIINEKFDIQVSTEYGIPEDVLSKWKFTLCTGFAIFQSNENVISFIKQFLNLCFKINNDQVVFNQLLLQNGIKWEQDCITKNIGYVEKFKLRIEAMDYFTIGRTIEDDSDLSIYHPFLPSNNQNLKIIDLVNRLKLLSDDPFLDDFMQSIITNPIGWIVTAYGWAAIVCHKGIRKIRERIN